MQTRKLRQIVVAILAVLALATWLPAQERDRERDGGEDRADRDRDDRDAVQGPSRQDDSRFLPPQPGRRDRDARWYLGVEVEYRDFGAQITSVERQSPARRAGLEMRDVIVTVNGYQVGRIGGRLYRLDRELELRADRRGNVLLLVQNQRNGQLAPLPVRLEPAGRQREPSRATPITGTVSYARAVQLPRGAVLTVRLLDVTDRRLPAREMAERTYRDLGPLPIPFDLDYDPDRIEPGRAYALEAEITNNGFTALKTRQRYPVLDTQPQGRVHMVLEPVRR